MGGKEAVENPLNEQCEPVQVVTLSIMIEAFNRFNELMVLAVAKMMFQSDHMAGDTGEFFAHQALEAGEAYSESTSEMVTIINDRPERGQGLTKDTYYKVMFHLQEKVLPAVKTIEQVYGDNAPRSNGVLFSEVVGEFVENA